MAVSIIVIAAVTVIVVLLLIFIIYKIIQYQRRNKAATVPSQRPSNNYAYEKLVGGLQELEQQMVDETATMETKPKKKKKRRRKNKSLSGPGAPEEGQEELPLLEPRLQLSISYLKLTRHLSVTIHQGENFASGSTSNSEVRVTLLPSKTQRFKTKFRPASHPDFEQFFTFEEVTPDDFEKGTLRLRCYILNGHRRVIAGEINVELYTEVGLEENVFEQQWRDFIPAEELLPDDISDTAAVTDPESALAPPKEKVPVLLICLQHRVSGKLKVEIIKARHMKILSTEKAPAIFVDMVLLNSRGGEQASAQTSVSKRSFHPTVEQTFHFPAIEFELDCLTLVVSVFNKKFRRSNLIGSFRLGRQSTGERERVHWDLMTEAHGEPVEGWHFLTNEGSMGD